jgi:hypothetical protein
MNPVLLIKIGIIIHEAVFMGKEERYSTAIVLSQVVFSDGIAGRVPKIDGIVVLVGSIIGDHIAFGEIWIDAVIVIDGRVILYPVMVRFG